MRLPVFLAAAGLVAGAGVALGQPAPTSGTVETEANPMLSDRMPYCESLIREVATWQGVVRTPHLEADNLAVEGARMCRIGHVRQGVRRLRFAGEATHHGLAGTAGGAWEEGIRAVRSLLS